MNNNKFRFVDLPGYGYSLAGKEETAQYLSLIKYYLTQRRNLKRVLILIDGRIGLKEIDKDFIYWLVYNNINLNIVLTKADKVNQNNLHIVQEGIQKWMRDEAILARQINTVSVRIRYPDLEVQIIDGTIIRAHACTAEYKKDSGAQEALGRSKDGLQLLLIKKMILHRLKH
ncbi:P-loop containing nucleoside triphosphate hydrolase [Cinara cedri]|uniref:P-loop containing nucleoside triphosphate hydrolase n=1 Tax=Cinara cedri TaxID=506608 RepID=A0A5E4NNG0_9HEMI|nr:P-loop containing nucleoside triphosphate hydrolase [Cinara cedri]